MNVKEAYNSWAVQYDTNQNKTRDLEGVSLRKTLAAVDFASCLEIGCGTGKNTAWLATKATKLLAVDFSDEMLAKARAKIQSQHVEFIQADITDEWYFVHNTKFDLVTFSLVLEHIEHLESVFEKLSHVVNNSGYVYIGELHPFKQYNGTKARFETEDGLQLVTCFNHNVSDFTTCATTYGFELIAVDEFFDNNDRTSIPRILTLLLKKSTSQKGGLPKN